MSAATTPLMPSAPAPVPRLLTAADLAVLPDELPTGRVKYELQDGRLAILPPPGDIHAAVSSNVVAHSKTQGEWAGHGKARDAVSVILGRHPDRVVGYGRLFDCQCIVAAAAVARGLSGDDPGSGRRGAQQE